MNITVTNPSATDSVIVPAPVSKTLAALATTTVPVEMDDFFARDQVLGDPLWKKWDVLLKQGLITVAIKDEGSLEIGIKAALALAAPRRQPIGPFVQDNVAANQASVALAVGATAAPQVTLVPTRDGSLVGISASFTVAPAGTDLTLQLTKEGVAVAGAILTVAAGATLGRSVTFPPGKFDFLAGQRLGVVVITGAGWTAVTSDVAVMLEIIN